ncbi:MAG: hypothetical protein QOF27_567, partial [Gaiellaceae bacterium]|nr:hypothetical protein [Gaiellaceae bacterium]
MAKKVRTPPPPRRVQAPQKRDPRKSSPAPQRSPWLYAGGGAAVVVLIAAVILGVVLIRKSGGSSPKFLTSQTNYNTLPGIRKAKAPWPPEYRFLADRLLPLGLTPLAQEALKFHIHQHLDIFVNGKAVSVPALIGINPGANYLTELHTHDARGLIHVESPVKKNYTLGQFFGEWAVYLDAHQIGGYTGMKWYLDGKLQTENPATLVLKPHQEIAFV